VYQKGDNLFAWSLKEGTTEQLTKLVSGSASSSKKLSTEELWVKQQQLETSAIIKERKDKADLRKAFLQSIKDADTLHVIYTGDNAVNSLQISPDGRFVTYNLYTE